MTALQLIRADVIGEIGRHQWGEGHPIRQCRLNALAIGDRRIHGGHRRPQVGHHNRARKLPRGGRQHLLEHHVITQMHMPVIRPAQHQLIGSRSHELQRTAFI